MCTGLAFQYNLKYETMTTKEDMGLRVNQKSVEALD